MIYSTKAELREFVQTNCPDKAIAQYLIAVSTPIQEKFGFPFDKQALLDTIEATKSISTVGWLESFAKTGKPILILRGALSTVWSKDDFRATQDHFKNYPNISFLELEGASHGLPFEKRRELALLIQNL